MNLPRNDGGAIARTSAWPSLAVWALSWAGLLAFDDALDLANKALILVLTTSIAAIWSRPMLSIMASAVAILAFSFAFVPPRGTFAVDLSHHIVLLITMLVVSSIVALLVARLRDLAALANANAMRSDQLRRLGEGLRNTDDPLMQAAALQEALAGLFGKPAALLLRSSTHEPGVADGHCVLEGGVTPDEAAGLKLCLREGRAMGPGTGRYEELPAWYLPLRGRQGTPGSALVRHSTEDPWHRDLLEFAQAMCDQTGAALERASAQLAAGAARERANAHALRNTLLTAISHDHRTPLATILSASSALHDQGERLTPAQRLRLAATIADEATHLSRLTENTLQLASLGAGRPMLQTDWESVEEVIGTVLHRVRQRDPRNVIKVNVAPGLPLLRCDAVLMIQLLENLVDNAIKYGGPEPTVEVLARRSGDNVMIAVRDRGPGVDPELTEHIFDAFQRASHDRVGDKRSRASPRGAGVGLALCRAIAREHGGDVHLRQRRGGGASFEIMLPVEGMPQAPTPADDVGAMS